MKLYNAHAPAQASQLDLFRDRLPAKPYYTDDLRAGVGINRARYAALCRYIQPNGPTHKWWLVYDVDRPGAAIDWSDRGPAADDHSDEPGQRPRPPDLRPRNVCTHSA